MSTKQVSLQDLIDELYSNIETDFEGDSTYRVHVKTAERLIREAYNNHTIKDLNDG